MERNLKISLDEAKKLYQQGNEAVNTLLLQTFTKEELEKKKLPESWEELVEIGGYYTNSISEVKEKLIGKPCFPDKNTFRTKEQAEAAIALAQLSQLMYVWNEGWEADWHNPQQSKFCISCNRHGVHIDNEKLERRFLAFRNLDIATEFVLCHEIKKLIEQAKPLL